MSFNRDMCIVFLFGAGASYGSLDCTPYCPPMGYHLFDELRKAGGIATSVDRELAAVFRQDFEKGMDQFFGRRWQDIDEFLRDMAKYFAQFEPGPDNLYRRLIGALKDARVKTVFSTLNYDLLIEIAASQAGLLLSYDLPLRPSTLRIRKIHGSCNFLPDIPTGMLQNVKIESPSQTGTKLEAPIRIAKPRDVIEFCEKSDYAPAIAIYAPSKWIPFCASFVHKQRKYWQAEVYQAECIFVIGATVRERDAHIWGPLARSEARLIYVDPEPEEFCRWANANSRKRVDIIPNKFAEAIPYILQHIAE